jgi:hypothetical protein
LPGVANADGVSYQLKTSVASSYVSRGIPQYAHRNEPSSQNTASLQLGEVGPGALSFTAWNAVALGAYDQQPGNAVELDLSVGYAFTAAALTVTTGYTAALFPEHAEGTPLDGTHELSAMVSYDNPYVVPAVAAAVEVVHQQGVYLSVGASRDLRHHDWTFSPAVSAGAATYRRYQGAEQAAAPHLNDVTAAVGARRELGGGVYASGKLSYSLCGTPHEIMPMDPAWGFDGRSMLVGAIAVGVAR